jgi:hypothetical protein
MPTTDNQKTAEAQELKRLRSTNELYDKYKPEWDLNLAAYEGGKSVMKTEYVARHPREHVDDYNERLKRLHYHNYCERLVDYRTDFIFGETIQRDGADEQEWYTTFLTNVNRKGEAVEPFMREVADDKDIFGMSWVLVDAPELPEGQLITQADVEKIGFRPYWVLMRPTEILDWIVDPFDKLLYVKRQQYMTTFDGGAVRSIERYTEWTETATKVTDVDVTDTQPVVKTARTITQQLGLIPIHVFRYKRSKQDRFMAYSFLRDFALNNIEILNLTSLEQEFLYRQCFSILAQEMDTAVPLKDQQQGVLGSANMLLYPKGAKAPQYITPSADPAKYISEARQGIVAEMFRRAAQDTVNDLFGGHRSGFAQSQTFSTSVPKIAASADVLERGEMRLMELTMRYLNKQWKGSIKYKDRYEVTNLTDAITQLTSIFRDLQLPSQTFAKVELKRIVDMFDGKFTADERAEIHKEIDALKWASFEETQKEALVGKPNGTSPAEQQKGKQTGTTAEVKAEATREAPAATNKLKT